MIVERRMKQLGSRCCQRSYTTEQLPLVDRATPAYDETYTRSISYKLLYTI